MSLTFRIGLGSCIALCAAVQPASAIDRTSWISDLGIQPGIPLIVLPPAAGAVIAVDEQRMLDKYVQTITLQGDPGVHGENRMVVTVTRRGLAPRMEADMIQNEAADLFPDMSMSLGPVGTRNTFGLFGSMVGSRGAESCLYGWQGVNLADKWITTESATPFDENHALSIRVRLCRTQVGTAGLLGAMAGAQPGVTGGEAAPVMPMMGYDALSAASSMQPGIAAMPRGLSGYGSVTVMPAAEEPRIVVYRRPRVVVYQERPRAVPHRRRMRAEVRRQPEPEPEPEAESRAPMPLAGMPTVPLPGSGAY